MHSTFQEQLAVKFILHCPLNCLHSKNFHISKCHSVTSKSNVAWMCSASSHAGASISCICTQNTSEVSICWDSGLTSTWGANINCIHTLQRITSSDISLNTFMCFHYSTEKKMHWCLCHTSWSWNRINPVSVKADKLTRNMDPINSATNRFLSEREIFSLLKQPSRHSLKVYFLSMGNIIMLFLKYWSILFPCIIKVTLEG